jgi:UDP-GlcNAc:undecaprenyl-phosphate GlcNAc-1-phosphate transferase
VEHSHSLWAVLAGLTIIVLAGLLDDLVALQPYQKIIAQVAAAVVLVAGGVIFRGIPSQVGGVQWIPNSPPLLLAIGVAFQVFLVVAACNATNLLDGLDGLCGGVTAIIAIGFLLLATSIAGWHEWGRAPDYPFSTLIIAISLALLGTALGFLPYNFNPASIFMGDAGSMSLGFVCATLMIMFSERQGMLKWFVGALFIFGLPIFDTALAYARRKLNGRPIFQGDRSHFYDQLVDRGLSVRQAVLICYGLALFFAIMGVGIIFMRTRYGLLVYIGVATILAVTVYKAGMLRVDPDEGSARNPTDPSRRTEGSC